MSLYTIPSQLYSYLSQYKRSSSAAIRADFGVRIIAMLCHFLSLHGHCISDGGGWDVITNVPSTQSSSEHSLVAMLRRVTSYFGQYELLLHRGHATIGHLVANDDGFASIRRLDGERVLLIDDTYTSGARAQSAASALALAGADVAAIVPVGRVIDPAFKASSNEFWTDQLATPFDFANCCVH